MHARVIRAGWGLLELGLRAKTRFKWFTVFCLPRKPPHVWLADITYLQTRESWLYLVDSRTAEEIGIRRA
jgi:hypothetical protein